MGAVGPNVRCCPFHLGHLSAAGQEAPYGRPWKQRRRGLPVHVTTDLTDNRARNTPEGRLAAEHSKEIRSDVAGGVLSNPESLLLCPRSSG